MFMYDLLHNFHLHFSPDKRITMIMQNPSTKKHQFNIVYKHTLPVNVQLTFLLYNWYEFVELLSIIDSNDCFGR